MKELAIRAGYVTVGYFSPEASSNNEYPPYIDAAVTHAINKIRAHQSDESITFAFMTDIHYSKTPLHD